MSTTNKKKFFEIPTQVKFVEDLGEGVVFEYGGIAYLDKVICGCCGNVLSLEEIYANAPLREEPPVIELPWIGISEEIKGS